MCFLSETHIVSFDIHITHLIIKDHCKPIISEIVGPICKYGMYGYCGIILVDEKIMKIMKAA